MFRSILLKVAKLFCYFLMRMAKMFNVLEPIVYDLCINYEKFSSNFIRYRLIPKYSTSVTGDRLNTIASTEQYGIIIQGQLIKRNDFTKETVRIYKKIFPMATIIISTWVGEDETLIDELREEECIVILCDPPKPMGLCHLNYQIVSTQEGLKKAKELGLKYCLKNRSDLRLNYKYSLEYLTSLLNIFKVKGNDVPLNGRIITLNGIPGQMFFPYWIQDYTYFGYTDDLIDLFDITLDERNQHNSGIWQLGDDYVKNGKDFYNHISPEMYVIINFLKKYVDISSLTVKDSWYYIKNYFLVVDFEDLNVVWDKYNRLWMNKFMGEYDGKLTYKTAYMPLTFQNFVNLYCDQIWFDSSIEKISEDYTEFII